MADKKFNLQFEATLEIGKMKTALDQINKSLTQTSVNLPKGISSTLNKTIQSIRTEMMKLEGLDGIELSPQAAKDVSKTYNSLLKNFQNLKVIMGDIGREFNIDPQRFFPKELSENIDNATKALNKYNNALNKGPQTEEYKALVEDLKKANRALEEYNDKASKVETKGKIATTRKDELQKELNIQKAISEEAEQAVKSAQDQIDAAQAQARTLKQIETLERKIAEAENRRAKAQAKSDQKAEQMSSKKRTDTKVYAELESSKTKADAEVAAETTLIERYRQEIQAATESAQKIQIAEEQKTQALERAANARKEVKKAERSISSQEETIKQAAAEFTTYSLEAQKAEASVTELAEKQKKANDAFQTSALKVLVNELNQLGIKVPEVSQNLPSIQNIINNLSSEPIQQIAQALEKAGVNAEELEIDLSQVGNKSQEFVELSEAQKRSADEMQRLKNQILDFFSVTNAIQLFKRTVQSALNTVKELDAVMTETAVVTEFGIGDMWEKLPDYAAHANNLGASIKDVYAATTLYYQQGLKTNEAMSVGVETMKMARIAGIDAANATEAMTAALRGFNMEVNETNAVRVNDVYSELAAVTAADTEQIATAMSKTASIAASANMEFETTAALLAQIIETTQEAPETAGTAMKTIIARFSEVKKLRSEMKTTGEDEEGEVIDVNKIQGALRSVGISMDDFFAGTEGLDSILLKLAEKWKTLDFETQRYIATTAAGSRQQSRFIAMMSDYERTMELATAANNSAGASQEQFDKTLESMEAKLQKLKNAWDEFSMGLANNEALKIGVDFLTNMLEAINKVISGISGDNGLSKSLVSLVTVIGALKGGGMLFNKGLTKGLGKMGQALGLPNAEGEGKKAGKEYSSGFERALATGKEDGLKKGFLSLFGEIGEETREISSQVIDKDQLLDNIKEARAVAEKNWKIKYEGLSAPQVSYEDATKEFDALSEALNNGVISADTAKRRLEELGTDTSKVGTITEITTKKIGTLTLDMQSFGTAAIMAGGAAGLLASYFDKLGKTELANKLREVGTVLTGIGTGISGLTKIFPDLNKAVKVSSEGIQIAGLKAKLAWGEFIIIIAAVAALVWALSKAFKEVYEASPEGKLKAAEESAEKAAEAAKEAAEAFESLSNAFESIEGKETALDELTVGTQEWRDAVAELNNEILELINLYPELSDYTSFENGVLKISEEGKKLVLDKQRAAVQGTQTAKIASQIEVQKAQQKVDFKNLDSNLKVQKGTSIVSAEDNPTISNEYLRRTQAEYGLEPHYGSSAAFPNQTQANQPTVPQTVVIEYDEEKTQELAKIYARGDFDPNKAFEAGGELEFLANRSEEELAEFKRYGQELIASEGAIKVFTDALLNNAIVNGEVDQKYNNAMMNLADPETINKMVEEKAASIDSEDIQTKTDYAKAMGYELDEKSGKFYSGVGENKKEVVVTDKDIKNHLAYMSVMEDITGRMKQLEGVVGDLEKNGDAASKAFVNIVSSEGGAGLTTKDLENNANADSMAGQLWLENKDDLQEIYGSYSAFRDYIKENYDAAKQQNETNKEKLSNFNAEGIFDNVDLSTGAATKITDKLYDTFIISGEGAANELSTSLQKIFDESEMSPEEAENFAKALTEIDWSSIDSVEELDKIMADYGVTNTKAIDSIEELEDKIIKASKASKNFDLDKLREELKKSEDLVKDIKGREDNERTFTKEQRDLMVEANPELEGQFVMTGLDEFTYIGDSMDNLVTALDNNTNALLGEEVINVDDAAARSQKWIAAMEGNKDVDKNPMNEINFQEAMQRILNGENLNDSILQQMLMAIGANTSGTQEEKTERIKQLYEKDYGAGGVVAQQNIQAQKDLQQIQEYEKYKNMSTDQAVASGASESQVRAVMMREAQANNLDVGEVTKYADSLKNLYGLEQKLADRIAIDNAKMNQGVKELSENYDDWAKAIKLGPGNPQYQSSVNGLRAAAQKLLGTTEGLSDKWLTNEKNMKLFKKAAEGDHKAIENLRKSATKELVFGVDFDEDKLTAEQKNLNRLIDNLDLNKIKIGTSLDDTGLTEFFNNLIRSGQMSANEVNSALESINFEPQIEYETVTVDGNNVQRIKTEGGYYLPDGTFVPVSTDQEVQSLMGSQVSLPVINGKGTKSKGPIKGAVTPPKDKAPKKTGGKKSGGSEKWENPYDKQYNTVQKINNELRKREKLEKRYQNLVAKSGTTPEELRKNLQKQAKSVKDEMELRQKLLNKRKSEMKSIEKKNKKYEKYAYYDEKEGRVVINWKEINKIKDPEKGKKVEDYIKKLEEKDEQIKSEEDALEEQTEILRAIYEQGRDEYLDLEDRVKEALVGERQKEIDKLSAINDSINDTNSRLISAMQASIDKYRQDRENARTEEDLSDKQRRLAYLRQDTSGANALEIMALEKELQEGQEDYTDTLVDQKISELQQQNDEAAEQRERQIQIAQEQLDKYVESGEIWSEVNRLMSEGIDVNKGLLKGSELEALLKNADNFSALSGIGQMKWLEELENNVATAVAWLTTGGTVKGLLESGALKKDEEIEFTTADGETVKGRVQEDGSVKTDSGEVYKNVRLGYDGSYVTDENYINPTTTTKKTTTKKTTTTTKKKAPTSAKKGVGAAIYTNAEKYGWGNGSTRKSRLKEVFGSDNNIQSKYVNASTANAVSNESSYTYAKMKKKYKKGYTYKTGGLADFTGPAWLDGTKSRPEYVLNADQTQAFFNLIDVLEGLRAGTGQSSQITGDSIYDVDINVESIGSDYDVEQLASTVKRMIVDDARYRNNNVINLSR